MMSKLKLTWSIYHNEINCEVKYCPNCGEKTIFTDSLKRRQNANGKNIFYFAIYKCPKGHTWNKQIEVFKAVSGLQNSPDTYHVAKNQYEEVSIPHLIDDDVHEVEILLNVLQSKERLDKFLASKIKELSRTEVVKSINSGFIRVNGSKVSSNVRLKEKDVITLLINRINVKKPAYS